MSATSNYANGTMNGAVILEEEDLTCPICLEVLHKPRSLPCSHIFCLLCLQTYTNSSCSHSSYEKAALLCPSCRRSADIPPNGVSAFSRIPFVESALENFKKDIEMTPKCRVCRTANNLFNCAHCKTWICQHCGPSHATPFLTQLPIMKTRLEKTQTRLINSQKNHEARLSQLESTIKEVIENKISDLHQKEEDLCRKARQILNEKQEKNVQLTSEIRDILQSDQNFNEEGKSWKEAGELYYNLHRLLLSSSLDKESDLKLNTSTLTLNTTEEPSVSENIDTLSDERLDREQKSLSIRDRMNVYRIKRSHSKQKWDQKVCERPAGIAISPWTNNIYVTASGACKVYVYNRSAKRISSFGSRGHGEGHFLCPVGIAFSEATNEIFVTDKWKHCVHVFDAEGNFLKQIGKKGRGFAEFSSPEGVATDAHGNIYVADTCNDRVQVLDNEGAFLREIGTVSKEDIGHGHHYTRREFREPTGIFVSKRGTRVYVADSGNHRIKVFNVVTGDRLFTVGSRGYNKGQFESPECVAVDSTGYILVGDSGNGRIQVLRPNGAFVRYLGSKKTLGPGELGWVSGIAISEEDEIIVTDFKSNSIAFY